MPPPRDKSPRAWQRMLSGRRLDLLNPSPLDIELDDIAHGLSRLSRWNGQTHGDFPFTVAQHSLLVEHIAAVLKPGLEARWRLAALLHDAAEYVIGDLISPFKTAVGLDYKAFEHRLEAAIHLRFGLPADLPASVARLIKRADRQSAYYEAVGLAGFTSTEARQFFGAPGLDTPPELTPLPSRNAQQTFVARFEALSGAMETAA